MEPKGQDGYSESGASAPEKSEVSQRSKLLFEEENSGGRKISGPLNVPLITQKGPCMNGDTSKYPGSQKHPVISQSGGILESATDNSNSSVLPSPKTAKDGDHSFSDAKTHSRGGKMMDARTNLEGAIDGSTRNQSSQEPNSDSNSEEEIRETDMLEEDNEQMTTRPADSAIKTRSLSPGIESINGNKRPAIICDFFAKGWCIKGSSCRFLHKRDNVVTSIRKDDEVAVVHGERKVDPVEVSGSNDVCERSLASSAGNYAACSSPFAVENTLPWEHGESKRCSIGGEHKFPSLERHSTLGNTLDHQLLASLRDDPGSVSSFKGIDRERLGHMFSNDKIKIHASLINRGSSHLPRNGLFPEHGSGMSSSTNTHATFSFVSSSGELACNRSQYMRKDTSLISSSLKSRSNTFLHTPGMSSIPQMLNNFFSLDASSSHAQKFLGGERDPYASRSASVMHNTSPCSAPKPECISPTKASRDPLHRGQFKSQIPKYKWEPSVPFRPSFFITKSILSTGNLYDPLRDSIEENNVGDISNRVCANAEEASFLNTSLQHVCQNSSLSSHNGINENISDKSCYKDEKAFLPTVVEGVGTNDADQQSGTLAGEENLVGTLNMHETPITNKIDTDCETTNQSDGERHKKDTKVDQTRQNNEVEIDSKRDRDISKESKALRHLRPGLIDMVKDLLKPTWHEGLLSKDAHNVIVKKAVDKVLSTLQPHQIPPTAESASQYLSLSQPKIAKLVEAYVEKYGKS